MYQKLNSILQIKTYPCQVIILEVWKPIQNLDEETAPIFNIFTNKDLLESYDYQKEKGYLEPIANGFVRSVKPADGIGAFKITAMDGKTYHYALPVYNHEIITRTFGVIEDSP